MMRGHVRLITVAASVAAAALGTPACGSGTGSPELTQEQLVGSWAGTVEVGADSVVYYWVFEPGDRYSTYDGCNRGGGTYAVTDGRVTFGQSGGTTRACLGEGADSGIGLSDPPDFAVEDSGALLVVETEVGEVRLPRVDTVPTVD